jgi:hypothetical protein
MSHTLRRRRVQSLFRRRKQGKEGTGRVHLEMAVVRVLDQIRLSLDVRQDIIASKSVL